MGKRTIKNTRMYNRKGFLIMEKITLKENNEIDFQPEIKNFEVLKPQMTERFALKLTFKNGEVRKYRFKMSDNLQNKEVVYNANHDYIFSDKIFANARLENNEVCFINGYSISANELYQNSTLYFEPKICNDILFENDKYKIETKFIWENAKLFRHENIISAMYDGKQACNYYEGHATFCDLDGKRLTSLDFHITSEFKEDYMCVALGEPHYKYNGYTFMDKNFNFLFEPKYNRATDFVNGYASVLKIIDNKGYWYIIDKTGKEIFSRNEYEEIGKFSDGLCKVSVKDVTRRGLAYHTDYYDIAGIWGYINEQGEEVIKPQYIYADNFTNGIARVCKGKWKPVEENDKKYWSDKELWGFIDTAGNEIIPCIYDEIGTLQDDKYIIADFEGKWGVLDLKGNWILEPIYLSKLYYQDYDYVEIYNEDATASDVWNDECFIGLYDLKEKRIVCEPKYQDISVLGRGIFCVTLKDKKINKNIEYIVNDLGVSLFPSNYKTIFARSHKNNDENEENNSIDYYEVKKHEEKGKELNGLLDKEGKELFMFNYDMPWSPFNKERQQFKFQENDKIGIRDFNENIIMPAEYEEIYYSKFGLYQVKQNNKWGLIDSNNNTLIPIEYEYSDIKNDGIIILRKNNNSRVLQLTEQGN